MGLKTMSGCPRRCSKTVKLSTDGMMLVVTGRAMHDTFHLGFKFSPGGLTVAPRIPFCVGVNILYSDIIIFLRPRGCKPTAILHDTFPYLAFLFARCLVSLFLPQPHPSLL